MTSVRQGRMRSVSSLPIDARPGAFAAVQRLVPLRSRSVAQPSSSADAVLETLASYGVAFVTFDRFGNQVDMSPAAMRMRSTDISKIGLAGREAVSLLLREPDTRAIGVAAAAQAVLSDGSDVHVRALPPGDTRRAAVAVCSPTAASRDTPVCPVPGLTPRESEVAALVAGGGSAKVIAQALGLSVHTVRRHTERIFVKAGVGTRTQLTLRMRVAPSMRDLPPGHLE